jgi:lysophospholipase L1-like esterase
MTLGLLALALEGIFRLSGLKPVVTINAPDPELGWSKRKSDSTRKSTGEFDVTFAINSLGLRDDEDLTRAKPAGTRRVLVLGDSFVLGYTVDRHDHFVDLVETAFAADGGPEPGAIQVLNGGTEGWSTDQELLWLRKEGFSFAPDVVVACFFQNDVWWNGQVSYAGTPKPRLKPDGTVEPIVGAMPPPRGWLATNSAIGGLLDNLSIGMKHGASMSHRDGALSMEVDQVVSLRNPPAAVADCWARTEACLRELKKSCDASGVKLLFLAIPTREEVEPGALDAWCKAVGATREMVDPVSPSQKALALAMKHGIATLDPRPALAAAAKDGAKVYFEKDWHVNPAGSRVLAKELHHALAGDAFLATGAITKGDAAIDASAAPARSARWPWVLLCVWVVLGSLYAQTNRDEPAWAAFLQVGLMIAAAAGIVLGFTALIGALGPTVGRFAGIALIGGFVVWLLCKMASKLAIIREVYGAFLRRGHWYMIPLLVAMLSIGGLLVVASSSPFIAPFIYTLF